MNSLEKQIMRSIKQLAQKECANYFNGICLLKDSPCHVINPAYQAIHDGAIDCDYFLSAVLPLQPELNTAVWHEILREEGQTGEGWKECSRCHMHFIPGSNHQQYCTNCGKETRQVRSREKQRRYRARQKRVGSVTL